MESTPFRKLREATSLTQLQVAQALKKTEATVSNWERCQTAPPLSEADAIARVYGVPVQRVEKAIVDTARAARGAVVSNNT